MIYFDYVDAVILPGTKLCAPEMLLFDVCVCVCVGACIHNYRYYVTGPLAKSLFTKPILVPFLHELKNGIMKTSRFLWDTC